MARRDDFGAPVDAFFARQPASHRALLDPLRALVEDAAPGATAAIKWGMPSYSYGKHMVCALNAHKAHMNLILAGPPGTFADPTGLLEGDGATGRRLRLEPGDTIPVVAVMRWLRAAAERARSLAG